jgi:hypothetical protein
MGGVDEVVIGLDGSVNVRSKIIFHDFIKGKIYLSPMEIILAVLKELEYLEGLVKLARKEYEVLQSNQMTTIAIVVLTLQEST